MLQEEAGSLQEAENKKKITPLAAIIICALLSVFLMRIGFLTLFYLVPIGYAVMVYGSSLLVLAIASAVGIIARLIFSAGSSFFIDVFYFVTLFAGFIWIVGGRQIKGVYRFVLASAAGAAAFLIFTNSPDSGFYALVEETAAAFFSSFEENGSYPLMQTFTPERLVELFKIIMLKGGAVVSVSFLFFINRQLSISLVWFFKRQKKDKGLAAFFAPANAIWVLSCALVFIILTRRLRIESLEILAWNVFVICAILFLAQGAGIVLYLLESRGGLFRLVIGVLFVVLLFSPGLNTIAIAALLLLGIVENWLPLRAAKKGQTSTPGS